MKPIKQLIADGDAELFTYDKLKDMLLDALRQEDYDELKWDYQTYNSPEYLRPIRLVRVTTFKVITDVKELENSNMLVY